MPTKVISCALVAAAIYLIALDHVDCAAIRRMRRKGDLSNNVAGNSTRSSNGLKVDGRPSLLPEAGNVLPAVIGVAPRRTSGARESDAGRQKKPVAQIQDIKTLDRNHSDKYHLKRENQIESNIQKDSDIGDNNGAGDDLENAENFENVGVENVIENIMNQNLTGKLSKVRRKDTDQEILRFKEDEDDARKFQRHQNKSLDVVRPAHPHPAGQRTSLTPLKIDELRLPDHVDGLRMEHDGHLNREYQKEVFLGNHEEFEWESESKLVSRLKDIFQRADINHDDMIELNELKSWIMFNVQNHLDEAIADNRRIFLHLDTNSDGFVTWQEFYIHFLLAKGYDLDSAKRQSTDYDVMSLDPDEKERIVRYKFRWAEADETPQDNRLTFDEFMNFRHPEQSKSMLVRMVKDLIINFDKNEDNLITEEEFVMLSPEVDSDIADSDKQWVLERKKEFREVIDINKDGVVDEAELKVYFDPHNANLAKLEAENLIRLADQDADGRLSLDEVLENAELFLGSKVVDASRNFHDEF